MARRPRNQEHPIGKQEGTPRRVRNRKRKMNIDDKMRNWQNTLDGGGANDLRRALGEMLEQFRLIQRGAAEIQEKAPDLTAAHYLEVCATLDAIRGSVEASEKAGRKTMALTVLRELLGDKADG